MTCQIPYALFYINYKIMNVKLSIIFILSLLNILPIAAQQVKFGVEAGANLSHYLTSQKHTARQNKQEE